LTLVDQDVLVAGQYEVGDLERLTGGIAVGPQQACHRRAGRESKAADLLGCRHADGELVEEAGRFQAKAFLEVGVDPTWGDVVLMAMMEPSASSAGK
jgi:hypothetical protein